MYGTFNCYKHVFKCPKSAFEKVEKLIDSYDKTTRGFLKILICEFKHVTRKKIKICKKCDFSLSFKCYSNQTSFLYKCSYRFLVDELVKGLLVSIVFWRPPCSRQTISSLFESDQKIKKLVLPRIITAYLLSVVKISRRQVCCRDFGQGA